MANVTIPDLTALGANVAPGDLLEIADISNANASRKVTRDELLANVNLEPPGFTVDGGGSAITTGKVKGFFTCPYAATITGWNIVVDTGTVTVKVWKIATGTAKPTIANVINTNGVALSTGTAIHSTTLTDFTTTAVAANDIFAFDITAVSGVTEMSFNLQLSKT